ncbi:MAG: XRE family transcriptional regulator [Finegoldia magna]|nr:XRE family transcriptional regulator [Finegoldia magna]
MKFDNSLGNKEIFAKNLQRYMNENNIDRKELSEKVNIPYSTLSDWINAKKYPRIDNVEILANFFNIDKSDLIEPSFMKSHKLKLSEKEIKLLRERAKYREIAKNSEKYLAEHPIREELKPIIKFAIKKNFNETAVPLLGTIAAGTPILAEQNIERYFDIDTSIHCDFCLRIEGNSMIDADIHNNDIVFIRQQPTLEIGEIGAFLIGEKATLKRFYRTEDRIILQPANSDYLPQIYTSDSEIKILGKLVATLHMNK